MKVEEDEGRGTPVGDTSFENLLETMTTDDESHLDAPDQLTQEHRRLEMEEKIGQEINKITGFVEERKDFRPLPEKSKQCPYCYKVLSDHSNMKRHVNVS